MEVTGMRGGLGVTGMKAMNTCLQQGWGVLKVLKDIYLYLQLFISFFSVTLCSLFVAPEADALTARPARRSGEGRV